MELYQEILRHILAEEKIQVSFPELTDSDSTKIVELECYRALRKIKAILEDDSLEDSECFYRIEEIVCVFEDLGSDCGSRHDFRLSSYPNEKTGRCAKPISPRFELPLYPTLSNGITLQRFPSGGSGSSGSGLAVAVSIKPPIFSAAPLCISLVMWV